MLKINEVIKDLLKKLKTIESIEIDDLFDTFFHRIYQDQTKEEVLSNINEVLNDENFEELNRKYYELYKDLYEEVFDDHLKVSFESSKEYFE